MKDIADPDSLCLVSLILAEASHHIMRILKVPMGEIHLDKEHSHVRVFALSNWKNRVGLY